MILAGKRNTSVFLLGSLSALVALGWTAYITAGHPEHGPVLCLFKNITGIPCPTCGVIRSATAILHGEFWRGLLINPLGLLLLMALISFPIWMGLDMYRNDSSLQRFMKRIDSLILRWYVLWPMVILTLFNWFWNISKGL
jgi:hypothetical protein